MIDRYPFEATRTQHTHKLTLNGGWRGCFSAPTPPSPESCFHPHPPSQTTPPHPPTPCTPSTFTLPHTATEWLLLCPLTQTFPQKRGRKPFTPFYLLPATTPPPLPPALSVVVLGQKRVSRLTFSLFAPSLLFLPPISHNHTHTHKYEHTHTYKLNPPVQQLYMR